MRFPGVSVAFLALFPAQAPTSPLADLGPAPEVVLTDQKGEPFRLDGLKGRCVLVSFIYTTCNGVCPATTHNLYRVQEALKGAGLWGTRVAFVSITLDPGNDTPEVLARYAGIYGCDASSWHFLTGPPADVERVWKSWDMWARRDPGTGVLDHPSRIFLLDPRGHRREIYNLAFLSSEAVLEDVRGLLGE
jgi:protein SCO1/2